MLAAVIALFAAVLLVPVSADITSRVHGIVAFTVPGETTPLLGTTSSPRLTPLGAQQLYAQGASFRSRYILADSNSDGQVTSSSVAVEGLSSYAPDPDQVYVISTDEQATAAGAMAFLQGLYPPFAVSSNAPMGDATGRLANTTVVDAPLDGYQYPLIQTTSELDPNIAFISGESNCPNYELAAQTYYSTSAYNDLRESTLSMYEHVGAITDLSSVLGPAAWDYSSASLIWDYLSYESRHNSTIYYMLNNNSTGLNYYTQLRSLASAQQWAIATPDLGTTTTSGLTSDDLLAIAGRTLAAKMFYLLNSTIATEGVNPKMSLIFADTTPLLSLFSIMGLDSWNSEFASLPQLGSSMVFELFSVVDSDISNDTSTFPSTDELWIRFYFKNGTGVDLSMTNSSLPQPGLISYPLFNLSPSQTDLRWSDFEYMMTGQMIPDAGSWCTLCDASSVWCPAFEDAASGSSNSLTGSGSSSNYTVTPKVAGVIGAVATLAVVVLCLIGMMLAGIRFTRHGSHLHGDGPAMAGAAAGGFKGPDRKQPDADVVDKSGHERTGSWELRNGPPATIIRTPGGGEGERDLGDGMVIGKETGLAGKGADMGRASFESDLEGRRPVEPTSPV